jgi:hypothetical protein
MNAAEAAALTPVLRPSVTIPRHFAAAAARLAPFTAVRLTAPGERTPVP